MDTQLCKSCEVELPISEFYYYKKSGKFFKTCKKCTTETNKKKHKEAIANSDRSLWAVYRNKPGEFANDEQKRLVYELLNSMGWIHNPDKELWYRKGIKDANGKWVNIKPKQPKIKEKRKKLPDGNRKEVDMEKLRHLRKCKWTFERISDEMNISIPTLRARLKKYG
jgi:hypothetical protein